MHAVCGKGVWWHDTVKGNKAAMEFAGQTGVGDVERLQIGGALGPDRLGAAQPAEIEIGRADEQNAEGRMGSVRVGDHLPDAADGLLHAVWTEVARIVGAEREHEQIR